MQTQNCHKKHVPLKGTKKTTLSTTEVCGTEDLLQQAWHTQYFLVELIHRCVCVCVFVVVCVCVFS